VRVVAGVAKGHRIIAPAGRVTRPTSDRVREAIFSVLESLGGLVGAEVLDLFAGSGALGIEALSRGAASAVFVDNRDPAVAAVRANLARTGLSGGTVIRSDAVSYLGAAPQFDVTFADPPYGFDDWLMLLDRLPSGQAVLESDRELELPEGWRLSKIRRYGGTVVTFAHKA
jgi:16S rRNA (guanine966-N2)-methyltransferase